MRAVFLSKLLTSQLSPTRVLDPGRDATSSSLVRHPRSIFLGALVGGSVVAARSLGGTRRYAFK